MDNYSGEKCFSYNSFGPLNWKETFVYYDGPLLWTASDKDRLWLIQTIDEDRRINTFTYLVVVITKDEETMIKEAEEFKDHYILDRIFLDYLRVGYFTQVKFDERVVEERLATKEDFYKSCPTIKKRY